MGASHSVHDILKDNIYISCLENDPNAELLCSFLRKHYNVIKFPINEQIEVQTMTNYLKTILSKSVCIIVCIREKTVRSFQQMIEMNNILDSSKTIIYLMTEKCFTPDTDTDIKRFIQTNKWFPAYDHDSVNYALLEINKLLL